MTSNEFSAYDRFNRSLSLWWLIALAAILGGVIGSVLYHLHSPVYEATATFLVNIDLGRFPILEMKEDLVQYNEDLAVNTTQSVLLSNDVLDQVISQAKISGIDISAYDLLHNYTIERKQEIWELRFRNNDPQAAQTIVNAWAEVGYQAMLSWQASGKAPDYVNFHAPTQALAPHEPVFYDRNKVLLAGILIGFIAGILISNMISWSPKGIIPQR
jgi:uncharacterized protein involved in exopolysaccharide biosynthesis